MEHTKEPWHTDNNFRVRDMGHIAAVAQDGRAVALTGFADAGDAQESIANARRIVACVNACAEISTATLEQVGLDVGNELVKLKQQRDELLAALELLPSIKISEQPEWEMSENNGTIWHLFLTRYCEAAIAKVKEQK